ncbi:MAG: MATE family efflux transporter [Clostridiales bacterium]|nr:MATE family efflux transporter [Clostridiales bacterium]
MTEQFGTESILKLMIKFSLPAIVASMVQTSYNLINMTFIGRAVGPMGIAAIAICQPITMIQGAINQLIGNGCAAAVAIRIGRGEREEARGLLGVSVTFSFLFAATNLIIGQTFKDPLLWAFGASEALLPYAREYLSISLFGMVISFFMMMNPMMRIEGYPGRAMVTMLLSATVNVIATPTFLYVFKLGIRGAAFGTVCGQVASATWMMIFLTNKNRVVGLKWRYIRVSFKYLIEMASLGLPTCLMNLTQSLLSVTMNRSLGAYGGDISISAWGVCNSINNLVQQPIFGMNQGAQPIIGYNVGAKNHKRVKQALINAIIIATIFATLGWLLTRFLPRQLLSIFTTDQEMIDIGTRILIVFRVLIIVVGMQQVGASYFQNSGKPRTSIFLTLSRQVLILMPAVLILPRFFGFDGILYAGPLSDGLASAITGVFILNELRRLNKLIREDEENAKISASADPLTVQE